MITEICYLVKGKQTARFYKLICSVLNWKSINVVQAIANNTTTPYESVCLSTGMYAYCIVSVRTLLAGPWCLSAAATDTRAGGVKASRASWGAMGRPSSETTASGHLHRNRKTSRPNGNNTGGERSCWCVGGKRWWKYNHNSREQQKQNVTVLRERKFCTSFKLLH